MFLRNCGYLRSQQCILIYTRSNSGYKVNTENYSLDKLKSNYTEEDSFQEKVEIAVLKKAKSRLRGFDKITYHDIARGKEGPNPNKQLKNDGDTPKYRSVQRYFRFAEQERRRQREEGVWWKNLNYWIKEREGNKNFTDIGTISPTQSCKFDKKQHAIIKRNKKDPKLEKAARERTLQLDLNTVQEEWEKNGAGVDHIRQITHHYNVYQDLFGNFDFPSILNMEIEYDCEDDMVNPVYYGNELLPSETGTQPTISYDSDPDKLYTILLTNPDEHLENNDREYGHWLVGNIPGCDVTKGDVLLDYLPPFPARGTGYQRMVFVLFEQKASIDFSSEKRDLPCTLLCERDLKTSEFYEKFETQITPVSVRFFQCRWEDCVKQTYHQILNMPEPVYEYAKLSERPRASMLKRIPHDKTLRWLARFMPKEPVYPDGNRESLEVRRAWALEATRAPDGSEKRKYPTKNLY